MRRAEYDLAINTRFVTSPSGRNDSVNAHYKTTSRHETFSSAQARGAGCSPAAKPGFTLLEMILAVALSALLMGLIAAGMRIYTQVVADRRAAAIYPPTWPTHSVQRSAERFGSIA